MIHAYTTHEPGQPLQPVIETFAMQEVNSALDHLRAGKARYRIVLTNK